MNDDENDLLEELESKHDNTVSKGLNRGTVSKPAPILSAPKIFNDAGHKRQLNRAIKRLRALLSNLEDINANEAIDLESWYRIVVGQLHESSVANEEFATRIAATGINFNVMSKRAAADKLQVHPHTLDRRLRDERFIGIHPDE